MSTNATEESGLTWETGKVYGEAQNLAREVCLMAFYLLELTYWVAHGTSCKYDDPYCEESQ